MRATEEVKTEIAHIEFAISLLDERIFEPFRLFSLPTLEKQFAVMLEEDFGRKVAVNEITEPTGCA